MYCVHIYHRENNEKIKEFTVIEKDLMKLIISCFNGDSDVYLEIDRVPDLF